MSNEYKRYVTLNKVSEDDTREKDMVIILEKRRM